MILNKNLTHGTALFKKYRKFLVMLVNNFVYKRVQILIALYIIIQNRFNPRKLYAKKTTKNLIMFYNSVWNLKNIITNCLKVINF